MVGKTAHKFSNLVLYSDDFLCLKALDLLKKLPGCKNSTQYAYSHDYLKRTNQRI